MLSSSNLVQSSRRHFWQGLSKLYADAVFWGVCISEVSMIINVNLTPRLDAMVRDKVAVTLLTQF